MEGPPLCGYGYSISEKGQNSKEGRGLDFTVANGSTASFSSLVDHIDITQGKRGRQQVSFEAIRIRKFNEAMISQRSHMGHCDCTATVIC